MKQYLEQRINELTLEWNETQNKLGSAEDSKMQEYYYFKCNKINACVIELKKALSVLEEQWKIKTSIDNN